MKALDPQLREAIAWRVFVSEYSLSIEGDALKAARQAALNRRRGAAELLAIHREAMAIIHVAPAWKAWLEEVMDLPASAPAASPPMQIELLIA